MQPDGEGMRNRALAIESFAQPDKSGTSVILAKAGIQYFLVLSALRILISGTS
jgi:hypothetical protein